MAENKRRSVDFLPDYLRTEKNNKFLSSTIDQLISAPEVERVDAFVGSKNTPNYKVEDRYLEDADQLRNNYQLEPALVVRTVTKEIKKAFGIDDLVNQIASHGGSATDFNRSFEPNFYSYDPKISWDKLVNFREYYWLPSGPSAINVFGQSKPSVVEFTVTDAEDGEQFYFNNLTTSQQLHLYKGTTYVFKVKSKHNFYIKYANTIGPADQVEIGMTNNGTNNGQIIFTVSEELPDHLFYTSSAGQLASGSIFIKNPEENTILNVEEEIIGKRNYTTASGIKFINGLKIKFIGTVYPQDYIDNEYIVEGVGKSINLIKFTDLETPDSIADFINVKFDGSNFDQFPFDNFSNIPLVPEYVTINKASKDLNPWTRYNRWFHSDVIRTTAQANGVVPVFPSEYRATRPIIEFVPNIKLWNFGSKAIKNVDLIDTTTKNVFLEIEKQPGFYVDSVLAEAGHRIIFTNDSDPLVRQKIFKVQIVKIAGKSTIDLVPEQDIVDSETNVLIKLGKSNGGTTWWFNGRTWVQGQQRLTRNQAPLFDLFDNLGNNYGLPNYITDFTGNRIFGYGTGTGPIDPILGFPLQYKTVGVEGTYLFKNYFTTEKFVIVDGDTTKFIPTAGLFLKIDDKLDNVWVKAEPYVIPTINGVTEPPINLTNNPLNLSIEEFTLSEVSDHVGSMVSNNENFVGAFPGPSNLDLISDISKYGSKLISNINPFSFAQHFISDEDNNIVFALRKVGENYNQFKINLLKNIAIVDQTASPVDALDEALKLLNINKTTVFPYNNSDMLAHGTATIVRNYKVSDVRNKKYFVPEEFDLSTLNNKSVLVYINGSQLVHGLDFIFNKLDQNITIIKSLNLNDVITVKYYSDTVGSFVPPTPTKLGLYPKYEPKIYLDDTYAKNPVTVLQGHDGSITVCYNDYRDEILLEYEKRVYNNIKVEYRQDLFDVNRVLAGHFRNQEFTYEQIINPIHQDFLKWQNTFSVEAYENLQFNIDFPRTFNYSDVKVGDTNLPGNWRAIFKLYFDTDRPHTHPWEMLGFSIKPSWWEEEYGPAPYSKDNSILWDDLEQGIIRQGYRQGTDIIYMRPGLKNVIPVDSNGDLLDVRTWGPIGQSQFLESVKNGWKFGDHGPAETAWRRSSFWPFAVQIMMAVAKPVTYSSLLFDTSRIVKNAIGQYVYSEDNLFLNHNRVLLPTEFKNGELIKTSGYSVFVVETGQARNKNYLQTLREELSYSTINLMHKVGGFVSKDKLEIVIDSVNPNSINPGVLLPIEDYEIYFNVSTPTKIVNISGVIVQKLDGKYILRGYDKVNPYFTIFNGIHEKTDEILSVGGKTEDYIPWSENTFYSIGQVVFYQNIFYRATNNHNSGNSFNVLNYSKLNELPIMNAITAAYPSSFEKIENIIPYGTVVDSPQEVCDIIAGYGKWLEAQGFVFDDFNSDINEILNWKLSIREFLYWSGQNWANNSVITLSCFSDAIEFVFDDSVVDDIYSPFYEFSIFGADGYAFPKSLLSISRTGGKCIISSKSDSIGIYFASLRLLQKEHALIFNNITRFGDVLYDVDTGYRQRRVRLIGLRTANWNGDYFSPGFIYDTAKIQIWKPFQDYIAGDVVEYVGSYYSLDRNLPGKETFEFTDWNRLSSKPSADLIPNFEYKLTQFDDFYSLEIDNFDISQQQLAQHLTGYTTRPYLTNIFFNQIAQYKFFQGLIKEKGTKNALAKLARASVHNLQGKVEFNEEWAFRIGSFGAYASLQELEFTLPEIKFVDNNQLIKFVDQAPVIPYDSVFYVTADDATIKPFDFNIDKVLQSTQHYNNLNPFALPVAGYVRLDDIDFTVKSKNDLLQLEPGRNLNQGDTVWVAFDDNGEWGAYRYTRLAAAVTSVFDVAQGQTLGFDTNVHHGINVGDIIAISRFDASVNGVYVVSEIITPTRFYANSSTAYAPTENNDYGVLFRFVPSRFKKFDNLLTTPYLADIPVGKKVFIDSNPNGLWEVYEKTNIYDSAITYVTSINDNSFFGETLVSKENNDLFLVAAPRFVDEAGGGKVYIYRNDDGVLRLINFYALNDTADQYYDTVGQPSAKFGLGLDLDGENSIIVAGAPYASNVKSVSAGTTYYVPTVTPGPGNGFANEGLVAISTLNSTGNAEKRQFILACQEPAANLEFGYSVFVNSTSTGKLLLVGAPGYSNYTGAVYTYELDYNYSEDTDITTVNVTATNQIKLPTDGITNNNRFGEVIAGDIYGKKIAVSAPGYSNSRGAVFVYENTGTTTTSSYMLIQTLAWNDTVLNDAISSDGQFGFDLDMDDSGKYLFVSAPNSFDKILQRGKVVVYEWTGTQYSAVQIIDNPSATQGIRFGFSVESDTVGNILTITSQGPNYFANSTFDGGTTIYDSEATKIGSLLKDSGSAHVYNRFENKFIYATELYDSNVTENSFYGYAVSVSRENIYVSSPKFISTGTVKTGAVHTWQATDSLDNSWNLIRSQTPLVDVDKIKQVKTINLFNDTVQDYLEVYDPAKGKIPRVADQEIRYKTYFDPAVYNTGTNVKATIDSNNYWTDEHLGELWWDLSSIKYMWYEQGDNEYRKNVWGGLFPNCTIDVYEWVVSNYLPTVWTEVADTTEGLSLNISGQPKYADDSAYTIKEIPNPVTNTIRTVYYYWVKNTVVVPNRQGRKISAYDVAGLIEDPKLFGQKYLQPLSENAISLVNLKGSLINERISINLQLDDINNDVNKHTEWLLLAEGNAKSMPSPMLEKKFKDSLLGRDKLGNIVPDPNLPARQKYGIGIRPRQSMFKDRRLALRNFVEYANTVFSQNLIRDFYNLNRLNSKENIPDVTLGLYDIEVESLDERNVLNLENISQAQITCTILNGRINVVKIEKSGLGYGKLHPVSFNESGSPVLWQGPALEIINDNGGSNLQSIVDEKGAIVKVNIINAGNGYTSTPTITVRPYTVIVTSDIESRGKWARYSYIEGQWEKIQTQSFDTTLYWDYTDWTANDYNNLRGIKGIVPNRDGISSIELVAGDYVKVLNNGAGRNVILRKTPANVQGNYDNNFDIVFSEKGTIKIKDSIWLIVNSQVGWDQISPFDNTFWDQTADTELLNIIEAIEYDIFIGNLKVHWNKIFFALIKYVLTEQKSVDWVFKTSFINATNKAGELLQRPVYKFQDAKWYEDYLNEIKPYHTKVREYTLNYDVVDPTRTYTTDFDLPVTFNQSLQANYPLSESDVQINTYPYKGWLDNKTLEVGKIAVDFPGTGYTINPVVTVIAAPNDNVSRPAKVEAVLSGGSIKEFIVLDPGEGYTLTPSVIILGGGLKETDQPAKASVHLVNRKVRSNKIALKFDRISTKKFINSNTHTDQFTGDGVKFSWKLSWPCYFDKQTITVKINSAIIASSDYELENFVSTANGYSQLYTTIIFDTAPAKDTVIRITYIKNSTIYNALDRIAYNFNKVPLESPGAILEENYSQLMKGIDYPGTEIKTADLWYNYTYDYSSFGSTVWDKQSFDNSDLDTIIDGGNTSTTGTGINQIFSSAAGIAPDEIILDGDTFISPIRSHAPEEMVPGETKESIAINVFNRTVSGSGMIYKQYIPATANEDTVIDLLVIPSTHASVIVTYNRRLLLRDADYFISYENKNLTVFARDQDGQIAITYTDVGGTGFISTNVNTSIGEPEGFVFGDCQYSQVKSLFVTVNGEPIDPYNNTESQTIFYRFVPAGENDQRAKVLVYGLGTEQENVITASFFTGKYKAFTEIYEQRKYNSTARAIQLDSPPGRSGPPISIVEINGRRLVPPNTTYYEIIYDWQDNYKISNKENYPPNSFDKTKLLVYKNGKEILPHQYFLDDQNNLLFFGKGTFKVGDVLAITALKDYDYVIRGETLDFHPDFIIPATNYTRIITFNNHDPSVVRTEVFNASSTRMYKLSRKILNHNLVWVSVGSYILTGGQDFEVLEDKSTILLDSNIPFVAEDEVIITSFAQDSASKTIGWKIFKDILGRTHYKRLSRQETTYLSQPLNLEDTEIYVQNGKVLPEPNIETSNPGIIFIAGERIEYMEKNGNVLSKIKRATMGTGAKEHYMIGTWVFDQGKTQSVPYQENIVVSTTVTTISTSTLNISLDTSKFILLENVDFHDQLEVYYGGKLLEKPTKTGVERKFHDAATYYDPINMLVKQPEFIITGTITTATLTITTATDDSVEIRIVQRRGKVWYNFNGESMFDQTTTEATFINTRDTMSPDDFYFGGDPILRLPDGTPLTLDNGIIIRGY